MATSSQAQATPQPDANGVYSAGREITAPKLIQSVTAKYPLDESAAGIKHVSAFSVVIGIDGSPASIEVLGKPLAPFDDAAIAAIRESRFEPGLFKGRPVPVSLPIWVPFVGGDRSAIPMTALFKQKNTSVPMPLNNVSAQFSDEARAAGVSGMVLVTLRVTEDGRSSGVRVVRSIGYGLDEEALKAVTQYRFKPAMIDGVPAAAQITVEVNFR